MPGKLLTSGSLCESVESVLFWTCWPAQASKSALFSHKQLEILHQVLNLLPFHYFFLQINTTACHFIRLNLIIKPFDIWGHSHYKETCRLFWTYTAIKVSPLTKFKTQNFYSTLIDRYLLKTTQQLAHLMNSAPFHAQLEHQEDCWKVHVGAPHPLLWSSISLL